MNDEACLLRTLFDNDPRKARGYLYRCAAYERRAGRRAATLKGDAQKYRTRRLFR